MGRRIRRGWKGPENTKNFVSGGQQGWQGIYRRNVLQDKQDKLMNLFGVASP